MKFYYVCEKCVEEDESKIYRDKHQVHVIEDYLIKKKKSWNFGFQNPITNGTKIMFSSHECLL